MEVLRPKKWDEFQHYKKRTPPWVKLHRGTLDNYDYHCLPIASKAIAPLMWLIASEYDFGEIPLDYDMISFRLRMSVLDTKKAIKPLIDKGFFLLDSTTLADCKQDSPLEGEAEEETEKIAFKGEFANVKLSLDETEKLIEKMTEPVALDMIERLSGYIASKGAKYKSHYATLCQWYAKEPKSSIQKQTPKGPKLSDEAYAKAVEQASGGKRNVQ